MTTAATVHGVRTHLREFHTRMWRSVVSIPVPFVERIVTPRQQHQRPSPRQPAMAWTASVMSLHTPAVRALSVLLFSKYVSEKTMVAAWTREVSFTAGVKVLLRPCHHCFRLRTWLQSHAVTTTRVCSSLPTARLSALERAAWLFRTTKHLTLSLSTRTHCHPLVWVRAPVLFCSVLFCFILFCLVL